MAGLGPAIHVFSLRLVKDVDARHKAGHDASLESVIAGLVPAITAYQHREGLIDGFTKRHGLKMLIYYEQHDDIRTAIQREKTIKHWPRAWKVRLIHRVNPDWKDLYDTLF
jgi:putative endonuclease